MAKISCAQALTTTGWKKNITVEIDDLGVITAITSGLSGESHVDCLLPAPLNLHSHSFQRAMSGLTERQGEDQNDSFWTWRKLMYRFLDQLQPEHIEIIATQVFLEMAEAGFAAVAEFHYLHHAIGGQHYLDRAELAKRIISAAERVGLGLTLLPVLYTYGGCDLRPLKGGQLRFSNDLEDFMLLHQESRAALKHCPSDYTLGVAPHSLRAIGQKALPQCIELAKTGPIHMHLAEQIPEVDEVKAEWGARPVEWLLEHCEVNANWCLIHLTHMTNEETRRIAESGAVAGLCPLTEGNLGDGIFNGMVFHRNGGQFGIGSDSNIQISLFEELKALDHSQRLRDHSRAPYASASSSSGRVIYEMAASGGAQAGGRNSGGIEVGKYADLLGIKSDNPWLSGRNEDTIIDSLIFGGHGQNCMSDLWSAGRHIVREGCHGERESIERDFMDLCKELGDHI